MTDPTGTPLNVLSAPNGKIIGTLANGVLGERDPVCRQREPWVDVADYKTKKALSWVFRKFVSCY